jgi:hypothetical protein
VIRWLAVGAAMSAALVLAAPGAAQREEPLTELWSEYPLVPNVEATGSQNIGPFLPPSDPEATPISGDSTRWSVWLGVAGLGLVAVLLAARTMLPAVASGRRARAGSTGRVPAAPRTRRREPSTTRVRPSPRSAPRGQVSAPLSQYAPQTDETPDPQDEPRRFVIRRTGLLRSRFVVYADEPDGRLSAHASSRSFWRIGGAAWRERLAEDAWDDLMNDLRLSGWEPGSARRSDFYVSLHRVESGLSSVVPTIEAYLYTPEDQEGAEPSSEPGSRPP